VSLLAVTKSVPGQHSSRGIYDWDLAEAAQAALLAQAQGASLLLNARSSTAPSLTFSTAGAVLLEDEDEEGEHGGRAATHIAAPHQQLPAASQATAVAAPSRQRGAAGIFGNLGDAFSKVQQTSELTS
jgi:UDP-3-O-[3-hydroxymyristoyl] glucosamine N-acyltransferase